MDCDTGVSPEETNCPTCGNVLPRPEAGSLFERISRQVEADHAHWRQEWGAAEAVAMRLPASRPGSSGAGVLDPRSGSSVDFSSLASAPLVSPSPAAQQVVRTMGTTLEVETAGVLNLLLLHAGFSPLRRLEVTMGEGAAKARLEISARPAVVLPRILPIDPRSQVVDRPSLAPDLDGFESRDEAIRGSLVVRLVVDGLPPMEQVSPVTIQPAGEWVDRPGAEVALAGAVTPNTTSVAALAASLRGDFMAYQAAGREERRAEVAKVYRGVVGLGLNYVGNPPSFEGTGQKILFPDQVIEHRRACCLDIALLEAALLERLGYRPLIFLLRDEQRGSGHALCGVWTADVRAQTPVLRDVASMQPLLEDGDLLVWNSTAYFEGAGDDFQAAEAAGRHWLQHFSYALDLAACRAQGLKPVPRRRS